ncbi:hypothetical protein HHX48_10835 [Salinimonas sp. HHU 13199]|uniref:DUF695 domain-containing protein n=1 Tax=Salinimonas profundi TaxID=2729140 RepID=A0ABR8LQ32_9ALTE|nr:hypothetical protein [Salinimonas profundi]MBD3586235.1 hypothetical protein [Salinimonas profundi]
MAGEGHRFIWRVEEVFASGDSRVIAEATDLKDLSIYRDTDLELVLVVLYYDSEGITDEDPLFIQDDEIPSRARHDLDVPLTYQFEYNEVWSNITDNVI